MIEWTSLPDRVPGTGDSAETRSQGADVIAAFARARPQRLAKAGFLRLKLTFVEVQPSPFRTHLVTPLNKQHITLAG